MWRAHAARVIEGPLFVVTQALSRAISFVLGWATSLFFGQIPGGKERVVSIMSAFALAWLLITYVGGPLSIIARDERALAILLGAVVMPPIVVMIAIASHLMSPPDRSGWVRALAMGYPGAISLGSGVLLMLLVGPIVLVRRWRRGLRTHHIPVLVAEAEFHELVTEIADVLRERTEREVHVGTLAGLWALPMRVMRFAAQLFFGSIVRADPVIVVAGQAEAAAYAMDVNVTAPAKDAYALRAALYKRFGVGHMHLTWSATSQELERRLWELREEGGLTRHERLRRLDRIERDVDHAAVGSDEWNVLYRIVLQLRQESAAARPARSA